MHSNGLQNIKLFSHYSKPLSCENSKCLNFASVQVKHSSKQAISFSHAKRNEEMSHVWHNGIQMASKISNKFPIIHSQWAIQIPDFSLIQVKQSKKTMVITWSSLKTWNSLPGFSVMIFCPIHVFLWHMESCLEDRVESVRFSLWGSPSVKDVFEVLKFLKWEFTYQDNKMLATVLFCH